MTVDIAPHEKEAMYQLVMVVRATAAQWTVSKDDNHKQKLLNWAQMVEDVVDRLDGIGR